MTVKHAISRARPAAAPRALPFDPKLLLWLALLLAGLLAMQFC